MPFILTSIAGLSTLLGSVFIFINFKNKDKIINIALAFAAGVMITVSLTDLIPESYNLLIHNSAVYLYLLISINLGIIISLLIDKFIPASDNLYRVGVISMIAIILHNIPEGIATYITSSHNIKLGLSLSIAIALHNIPEGISISLPIYYSTNSKLKAFIYTFISAISEIFGAVLCSLFLKNYINNFVMAILLGMIAGIMIHISFYELLPTTYKYKHKLTTLLSLGIGCSIMIISHILMN